MKNPGYYGLQHPGRSGSLRGKKSVRGTTRLYRLLADWTASIGQLATQDPVTRVNRLSLMGWKQQFGQWLKGDIHWIPVRAYTIS